jgi:hypothetical protein
MCWGQWSRRYSSSRPAMPGKQLAPREANGRGRGPGSPIPSRASMASRAICETGTRWRAASRSRAAARSSGRLIVVRFIRAYCMPRARPSIASSRSHSPARGQARRMLPYPGARDPAGASVRFEAAPSGHTPEPIGRQEASSFQPGAASNHGRQSHADSHGSSSRRPQWRDRLRIPLNSPGHSALNSPPCSRVLAHPSEAAPAADAKRQFIP